jgi:hypothetical protein
MQTNASPYGNEAGLIDKFIGTAYENVKAVAADIEKIKHVSDNMQAVYDFSGSMEVMEAFTDNPAFLQWLVDNEQNIEDLSGMLATLMADYAVLAGANFTGYTKLGELAPAVKTKLIQVTSPIIGMADGWAHGLRLAKIVGITSTVTSISGEMTPVPFVSGSMVKLWVDATHVRLSTNELGVDFANRPVNILLTYIE